MNRRDFLAGSIALAGQGHLARSMGALSAAGAGAAPATSPQNLLSRTFTESFLEAHLIPVDQYRPYPRWTDRTAWEAVPDDLRTAVIQQAEADQKDGWHAILATSFLEFSRDGNRTHYEAQSFGRRYHLRDVVLAECLEGKGRFLDDITNGIWLICEESFWGVPAHLGMQKAGVGLPDITDPVIELFGAETVQLLAWTRYLVGEQLHSVSPLIVPRIHLEAERRILKPARERDDFWWMGFQKSKAHDARLNNWTPWINSNLMVANLLLEQDPELRIFETTRILRSLDLYLNQYWPDAGEEEGPGYFSASPMCYFEAVNMIDGATGHATNILFTPFIDQMGRYILNAHICENNYIDYGDAHVHAGPDGDLLWRYGRAVHDKQLADFGAYLAHRPKPEGTSRNPYGQRFISLPSMSRALPLLLEAKELRADKGADVLFRDSYYPDLGLVTARIKSNSAEGMYFAVLACNNGRSHSHNDTGSYIIYQDCEPVAIDVGVEAYTAKTFSPQRYTIWTMQSAYHNLPTIGGVMQHNGVQYRATDRKYSSNDDRATYSFNIAQAYPKEAGVTSWVRTVTLDRKLNKVVVEEVFELEKEVPVTLSVITPRQVTPASGALTLTLASAQGKAAQLKYDAAALSPKVETIQLADAGLRMSWGPRIYRILLNSTQPVSSGKWSYEFAPA
ncbi:MAG TPA: heparinase II/III family protein [Terracidiphilus sp.]|nr:heparinase II/III family protein [Terracidiphilus sp.]